MPIRDNTTLQDLREFRRLRNYYRRTRRNGASDECFLNWCELMADWEREHHPAAIRSHPRRKVPAGPVELRHEPTPATPFPAVLRSCSTPRKSVSNRFRPQINPSTV
jgi:hypothetical protein